MKPNFLLFRPQRKDRETVTGHIPPALKAPLELIAEAEGGGLSGLVLEGLIRVLHDRAQEPEAEEIVREAIPEFLNKHADEVRAQLAETAFIVDSFQSPGTL